MSNLRVPSVPCSETFSSLQVSNLDPPPDDLVQYVNLIWTASLTSLLVMLLLYSTTDKSLFTGKASRNPPKKYSSS